MKNYTKIILVFFLVFSFPVLSFAQKATIIGKVIDSETAEVLRGASVRLMDTKKGAYTDVKGEFKIKDVPAGAYTIRISYIGYATKDVTDIAVVKDGIINLENIALQPSAKMTNEVVVTSVRTNDNAAAILAQRKNAAQVSDGISIEEIKKTPDADAGQSLKRVSGVTLINDKFVYVRGVSERYSNTTLNGTSLATTEPDKKAFAFDMFPSEFLENANVAKSFTPDLPGNFAGGLVQLNTIDFPQGFSLKFSATGSYSDNITFDKKFQSYNGGGTDWLGYDDGTRSMPSYTPKSQAELKAITNAFKSTDDDVVKNATMQYNKFSTGFNSKVWKGDTLSALPNGSYSLSYTNIFSIAGNDLGVMASLMYGNSYNYDGITRGQLQSDGKDFNYYGTGTQSTFSTNLGGMFNIAYKIGENNSISFKNTYNNSSDDQTTIIDGFKEQSSIRQYGFDYVQKTLYAGQLSGEHNLTFNNSIINWKLGYSNSLRNEPDFRRVRYSRNDTTQPFRADISDIDGTGYLAGRFFSKLNENAYTGGLDYTLPIGNIKLKTGAYYEGKDRDFNVRSFTIVKSNYLVKQYYDPDFGYVVANYSDDDFFNTALYESPDKLFASSNFDYHRLGMSEETKPTDSYKANEELYAGYLMADIPFTISNNKFRVITGLRIENSYQFLKSYYAISANGGDSTFVDRNQTDFLPALNLIYEINKEMNLRASASQTLTRPSLREYAPFTFYDFEFQGDVTGNPNLKRALIQNYDLRWEMFPNPGEVLSVSLFYKTFENAIEETIIPTSSNFKKTYDNAEGTAYNYGIEFEARKSLGFLGNTFDNFMMSFNLALINSKIKVSQVDRTDERAMWGQSPYTLNVGLFYHNPELGTSINLSYNVYGKRIIQVADIGRYSFSNPHVYELPRNVVDISLSQPVFKIFELKLIAKDLLNEKLKWKQGSEIISSDIRGRVFSIGIGYKL